MPGRGRSSHDLTERPGGPAPCPAVLQCCAGRVRPAREVRGTRDGRGPAVTGGNTRCTSCRRHENTKLPGDDMQKIRGLAKVTASLSLACGIAAAAAGPALAASPNEAYAAQATGPISAGPLDEATFPGTSPVSVNSDSIAGLLTA